MFGRSKKKKRKDKSSSRPSDERPRHRWLWRGVLGAMAIATVTGGAWVGMQHLERYAMGRRGGLGGAEIETVRIAFTHRPEWMPVGLAREIALSLVPPRRQFTHEGIAADIYHLAAANPHVAEVRRVVHHGGTKPEVALVEIDCRFRMPIARVNLAETSWGYAYVDAEGYHLPYADVPRWRVRMPAADGAPGKVLYFRDGDVLPAGAEARAVHYITIRGVAADAPPVGQPWAGEDIQDALRLVKLVMTRAYASQITTVDVRNHDGRISHTQPHLRMYAQVGEGPVTDIRFGRFPSPGGGDYEISPEVKMGHLDDYYLDHGKRLAGLNRYIDLQYDQLIYSVN